MTQPTKLGDLRKQVAAGKVAHRPVKSELRDNLILKLKSSEQLFPSIVGYDDSVLPQVINAILSQHNFIILGLRGQAKTRILRSLVDLLDREIPIVRGCEINDDPLSPLCAQCRNLIKEHGDDVPISWLPAEERFIEKLATPDVTIADIIGDIDPIKAAKGGLHLSDEHTIHYGLLPRANRGIFAVNELPDLASKIQVGLFNILQEGDIQIKGYPVRFRLDLMMTFTANPDDYTARGKIVTPLKDRIGSEIRTHYPQTRRDGMTITSQQAWIIRNDGSSHFSETFVPVFVREIVEEVAFQARSDQEIDQRSGVSQRLPISCLENVVSNAEHRALVNGETDAVARVTDIYAALPSLTGKFELEYEGELKGVDTVARALIQTSVQNVFGGWFEGIDTNRIVEWFEMGGTLQISDTSTAEELIEAVNNIQGIQELLKHIGIVEKDSASMVAAAIDFVFEGLYAERKISRTIENEYRAIEKPRRSAPVTETVVKTSTRSSRPGKKKNYYN
tara:strand:- start:586 stop:2103 length:1518 start_codon:yes stop_codon:yes gene_type:complete